MRVLVACEFSGIKERSRTYTGIAEAFVEQWS